MLLQLLFCIFLIRVSALLLAIWTTFRFLTPLSKYLLPVACGLLLSLSLTHLIPESLEKLSPQLGGQVMLAVIIFLLVCEFLALMISRFGAANHELKISGLSLLMGMSVHAIADTLVLTSAFLTNTHLGWIAAFAIFLHEIPNQISATIIYQNCHFSNKKTLTYLFFPTIMALIGGLFAFFMLASEIFISYALLISASAFLYMALRSFLPEIMQLNQNTKECFMMVVMLITGMLLGIGLSNLQHEHHHELIIEKPIVSAS